MRHRFIPSLLLLSLLAMPVQAAVSLPAENTAAMPAEAEGPAKAAMEAFQSGRHAKAVELATPLAEKGNAEALYLLGFAHESGKGAKYLRGRGPFTLAYTESHLTKSAALKREIEIKALDRSDKLILCVTETC